MACRLGPILPSSISVYPSFLYQGAFHLGTRKVARHVPEPARDREKDQSRDRDGRDHDRCGGMTFVLLVDFNQSGCDSWPDDELGH
jgi:hypothetical protein